MWLSLIKTKRNSFLKSTEKSQINKTSLTDCYKSVFQIIFPNLAQILNQASEKKIVSRSPLRLEAQPLFIMKHWSYKKWDRSLPNIPISSNSIAPWQTVRQ